MSNRDRLKKNQHLASNIPLICIIFLGFLWRLYYSHIAVIRGDETLYMYQSYLITKGMVPYQDFYCRSPVYLYFLAFFMSIFGKSIMAVRFALVLVSTFNILFVYLLGKKLKDKRTGLYSAAFFAFSPYTIRIGSMLVNEVLLTLMLTLAIYIITKALIENKLRYFIYAGIITALAVFVRRTGILFLVIVPLFILTYHLMKIPRGENNIKKVFYRSFKESIVYSITVVVICISLFFVFITLTSWDYMMDSFFAGRASSFNIHRFPGNSFISALPGDLFNYSFFSLLFFLMFLIVVLGRLFKSRTQEYQIFLPLSMFAIYYFITPFRDPSRGIMTGELFDLILLTSLICAAIPLRIVNKLEKKSPKFRDAFLTIIIIFAAFLLMNHLRYYEKLWFQVLLFIVAYVTMEVIITQSISICTNNKMGSILKKRIGENTQKKLNSVARIIHSERAVIFTLMAVAFLLFIDDSIYNDQEKTFLNICIVFSFPLVIFLSRFITIPRLSHLEILVFVWILPVFMLYTYWGYALDFYYYEFMVPLSLGAGFILKKLIRDVPNIYVIPLRSLITIAIVSILLSNSINVNTFEQQGKDGLVTPETSEAVADYLRERMKNGEEVMTADQTIAISAGLRIPYDISDPFYYRMPSAFPPGEEIHYPTLEELEKHMLEKPVRYCVVGPSTERLYFQPNPEFKAFVKEHYQLEKTIANVEIYKIKEEYL